MLRVLLLVGAMVAISACADSRSDSPGRTAHAGETRPAAPRSPDEGRTTPGALADSDPTMRLAALEAWALHHGATLDVVTYALVDPDESVRARAQEVFEAELARIAHMDAQRRREP